MVFANISRFKVVLGILGFFLAGHCGTVYGQQRYDTCKVYQFADSDSSYLEEVAIKEFSGGRLVKYYSVAGLDGNNSYQYYKRLKGEKVFKGGDTTKLQEIRRSAFASSEYTYNKAGQLQCEMRTDDWDGIYGHENSIYEYGSGRMQEKYRLDVSHDLIHGVVTDYYTYDGDGRIICDSAVDDHRLVMNYQWSEDEKRLMGFDAATFRLVPVSSFSNLQFRFRDESDTMNRRREVTKYNYFDGGYKTQLVVLYYFTDPQTGAMDSVLTNRAGKLVKAVTFYEGKKRMEKNYYYDSYGNLKRMVTDDYAAEGPGRITRIYRYVKKKR